MKYGIATGARQVISDINPTIIRAGESSTQVVDLQRHQWYKLLNSVLVFKGEFQAVLNDSSATDSAEKRVKIDYKSDHLYNLISNVTLKLNSNYEVKNFTRLSFLRFVNLLQDEGYADFMSVPKEIVIKQGESTGTASFKLCVPLSMLMYDMGNKIRSFLATWLYNAVQLTWQNVVIDNVLTQPSDAKITYVKDSVTLESASEYFITGAGVFSGASVSEVLNKMGAFYRVTSFEKNLSLGSNNVVIDDFTPTTDIILSNFWIILRDPVTNKRIDGIIKRMRFTDGNKPLFDCSPEILRQLLKSKYNFSSALFDKEDAGEPDGQGALYGVHKIDCSIFGDLDNAVLAVGNWRNPKLYVDLETTSAELSAEANGQVKFEIYQTFAEVPNLLQNLANQFVETTQGA